VAEIKQTSSAKNPLNNSITSGESSTKRIFSFFFPLFPPRSTP
jgi:hypothetical protein